MNDVDITVDNAEKVEVTTDPQDPMPESSWLYRRVFTYIVTAILLFFLWGGIDRLGSVALIAPERGVDGLVEVCKWIIGLTILMSTYYLIAPSAEQIVKMFKAASIIRAGYTLPGSRGSDSPMRRGRPPTQGGSGRRTSNGPPWAR